MSNYKHQKDEKNIAARRSSFRPDHQLHFQKIPILIHRLSNKFHGKSERLEVNTKDFRIVRGKIVNNVCYHTFN